MKRVLSLFILMMTMGLGVLWSAPSVVWFWSPSEDAVQYFRYQVDGEDDNKWTVVSSTVRTYVFPNPQSGVNHNLFVQQSYDGKTWGPSGMASQTKATVGKDMVPASSIQWSVRLTTGALFAIREQEGNTFGAYGKIVPEATLGVDVKNLFMITPRIDFGLVTHVAYQMYLFDKEGYDGTFNILGFGVLPRVRMNWGKASLYVLGGIETMAIREHEQNIMVYRGVDVPFVGVVLTAGVGGDISDWGPCRSWP